MAASENLEIIQGKTFIYAVRWEALPIIYKPITAISKSAPCVVTSAGHGIPDGWRVAVVSTKGMDQLRAARNPPKADEYRTATLRTIDTVELNEVNAADFDVYVSGGFLQFYSPVDLTGFTARMSIKDRVGGTVLLSLTTENGGITVDAIKAKITLTVSATDTAALTEAFAVYDLEMVSPSGVVSLLMYGNVVIPTEVTT